MGDKRALICSSQLGLQVFGGNFPALHGRFFGSRERLETAMRVDRFSEPTLAALERILAELSPVLQSSFLSSVKALGITGAIEALEQAFGVQDINAIINSLSWQSMQSRLLKSVQSVASRALSAGASEMGAPALLPLNIRMRFDLLNPRAVAWTENQAAKLVVQVTNDTRQALRTIINRAFVDHIPTREAAKLIKNTIGLHEQWANAVYNYEARLIKSGKGPAQVAKLVERYRERLLKARALNIARTECLLGDTLVDGAVIDAVTRRWYEGQIIEVATSRGRKFSATSNHPMLTSAGWKALGEITEADYLVCDTGNENAGSPRNENIQRGPSTLSEIFDSIQAVGIRERRRTGEPDFHGDGRQGYVDISSPYGELHIGHFAALFEPLAESIFAPTDRARASFCASCRRLLPTNRGLCFCEGSQRNVLFGEDAANGATANVERIGDLISRFEREVSHYNVVGRQVRPFIVGDAAGLIEQFASVGAGSGWKPCSLDGFNDGAGINTEGVSDGLSAVARFVHCNDLLAVETVSERGAFRSRTDGSIRSAEPVSDACGVSADSGGDSNGRQSGQVQLDGVRSISRREWSGHVFNLSTPDGYFTINGGIYTGNTATAANQGQMELWRQAAEQGLLDRQKVRRIWILTTGACALCVSLAANTATLDGFFMNEAGDTAEMPPGHPSCRCSQGLEFV